MRVQLSGQDRDVLTQWLLEFVRDVVVNWLRGLPAAPAELFMLRDWLVTGGYELNQLVSKFGVLIPWESFAGIVAVWIGLLGFWAAMLVVRIVMWAVGR